MAEPSAIRDGPNPDITAGPNTILDYPSPRMTRREVALLDALLSALQPVRCLEWGAGGSTLYFPGRYPSIVNWVSLESNQAWYHRLRDEVGPKVNLRLAEDPDEYIRALPAWYGPFDFILVDGWGAWRPACLEQARRPELLQPGGVVALHDSGRPQYWYALRGFRERRTLTRPMRTYKSQGLTLAWQDNHIETILKEVV